MKDWKKSREFYLSPQGSVLVVDDDKHVLNLIKSGLTDHHYDVTTTTNGLEAIQIIEDKFDIDLIILDLMMPNISGFEVATHLRQSFSLLELPILILTARNNINDMIKGFEAGANDYLSKPFNSKELISRVKTLVNLKQMYKSNSNLIETIDLKNQFINMTIHDLRNPLGVINSVLEMFNMELDLDGDNKELLNLALSSTKLMLNLVEELLETAKIESGKIALKTEILDWNELIENSIKEFKYNFEKKNQNIDFIKETDHCLILADKVRIKEVVDNLISNAIKYSPKGKQILVSTTTNNESNKRPLARFSVKDFGPGLSDEDLEKIFNPFQRLTPKPTAGEHTSGLGLSIVKKLVEYHNGKIWVETKQGEGCNFIVEVPLAAKDNVPD